MLTCQNLLIQPFAQTFRTVTAKADGFVVIDLHVVELVLTQEVNDLVGEIFLHLRLAHITEAAVACRDGNAAAGQLPFGPVKAIRLIAPRHFKLKPDTGFHARVVNFFNNIPHSMGKMLLAQFPFAELGRGLKRFVIVPARVNDIIAEVVPLEGFQMLENRFLGRAAPCGAELIEQHRHRFFRFRQSGFNGAAGVFGPCLHGKVHAALHGGHNGLGCGERFAGGKGLAPRAELAVCQPAGEGQPPILTVQFHLPAAALCCRGGPCHAVGGVLHRAKRHKAAHGKAANTAEPHTVGGVALPARLQLQILGSFGHQAPLGAPC